MSICRRMFLLLAILPTIAIAQVAERPAFDLNSVWLLSVSGGRTFTLQFSRSTQESTAARTTVLDTAFGFTDAPLKPAAIRTEVSETDTGRTLSLVTPIGSKVIAAQKSDGSFVGTITHRNGMGSEVSIRRLSEVEHASRQTGRDGNVALVTPSADVPAACASFIGVWSGDWGSGKRWLWVTEVDRSCTVKYAYSYDANTPRDFRLAEVKSERLSVPCGGEGWTCHFTNRGKELWAASTGAGGRNNTVFIKLTEEQVVQLGGTPPR